MAKAVLTLCLASVLTLASSLVCAGYLDNVEVVAKGENTIVRVRFNIGVQYLRHVPETPGDTLQIFLRQISDAGVRAPVSHESLIVRESDLTPGIVVTYPFQNGVPTKRLSLKFQKPVRFRVRQGIDPHSIEIVLIPTDAPRPAAPVSPVAPARFAIYLDTHDTVEAAKGATLPAALSRFQILLSKSVIADTELYDRNIGYFDTQAAAEVTRDRIVGNFPNARVVDVSREALVKVEPKSVAAIAPVPKVPAAKSAVPGVPTVGIAPTLPKGPDGKPPASPGTPAVGGTKPAELPAAPAVVASASKATPEVERQAIETMVKAREAFAGDKWDDAINLLNQLLMLPPNSLSAPAQELAGLTRERNGQLAKAKAEYESYLSLYPDAEGVPRVRERLALLDKGLASAVKGTQQAQRSNFPVKMRTVFGSLSQYYYSGKTKLETAFNTPTTVDQASLTSQDLSSIVTAADLTARYRSDESDTRLVFRGSDTHSLLEKNPSKSRLDAAYLDYRGIQNPVSLRVGRQVGTGGGIFGRFDGVIAGYKFAKNWRINADAGIPVDYSLESKRRFFGFSLDAENLFDNWHGNAYVIRQTVDGVPDREAVGGEIRYFREGNSLYTTVDYDTMFRELNVIAIQGSLQTKGQTNYTVLYEERKAPPLAVTNAIFGQPVSTVEELLQTRTEEQLRAQAVATTAMVKQVMASVTTPLSSVWQVSADYRLTNVGALPAYENIPATPSTGNIHGFTLQTIGSNLYSARDINVFSITFLKGQTYHGEYLSYSNLTGFGEKWTLEPALRAYSQVDNTDTKSRRYTAVLRVSYALKQNISFETEYNIEQSNTQSAMQDEKALHEFFYLGYRYSF